MKIEKEQQQQNFWLVGPGITMWALDKNSKTFMYKQESTRRALCVLVCAQIHVRVPLEISQLLPPFHKNLSFDEEEF